METYSCFSDLCQDYHAPADFRIMAVERAGPLVVLAPHGGTIERGTSELARAIAGDDLSLYLFESLRPTAKESKNLHITSMNFDEPACLRLVQRFPHSLALHGCEGAKPVIYVGGGDRAMKQRLIDQLSARGYLVKPGRGRLAGTHPQNICNRTSSGAGVQLELSSGLRSSFFQDWHNRRGRRDTTPAFDQFVADLRSFLR